MTKEQLTALGLTDEQAQKVMDAYTESLKGFIPKARFDEVSDAKKDLEKQIGERDTQLTELNKKVKGNEELEKTIKTLQDENKSTKESYEARLKDLNINTAILAKLTDTKYPDLLATKFDKTKLVVAADGTVSGIDEQLTAIKESYKDLFTPPVTGRDSQNRDKQLPGGKNPWSKEHFNLTEQGKILRENPQLAAQLKASAT